MKKSGGPSHKNGKSLYQECSDREEPMSAQAIRLLNDIKKKIRCAGGEGVVLGGGGEKGKYKGNPLRHVLSRWDKPQTKKKKKARKCIT